MGGLCHERWYQRLLHGLARCPHRRWRLSLVLTGYHQLAVSRSSRRQEVHAGRRRALGGGSRLAAARPPRWIHGSEGSGGGRGTDGPSGHPWRPGSTHMKPVKSQGQAGVMERRRRSDRPKALGEPCACIQGRFRCAVRRVPLLCCQYRARHPLRRRRVCVQAGLRHAPLSVPSHVPTQAGYFFHGWHRAPRIHL